MEESEDLLYSMNQYLNHLDNQLSNFTHSSLMNFPSTIDSCEMHDFCQLQKCVICKLQVCKLKTQTTSNVQIIKKLENENFSFKYEIGRLSERILSLEAEIQFAKNERNSALEQLKELKTDSSKCSVPTRKNFQSIMSKAFGLSHLTSVSRSAEGFGFEDKVEPVKSNYDISSYDIVEDKFVHLKLCYAEKCEEYIRVEDELNLSKHSISRLIGIIQDKDAIISSFKSIVSNLSDTKLPNDMLNLNTPNASILNSTTYSLNNPSTCNDEKKETAVNQIKGISVAEIQNGPMLTKISNQKEVSPQPAPLDCCNLDNLHSQTKGKQAIEKSLKKEDNMFKKGLSILKIFKKIK